MNNNKNKIIDLRFGENPNVFLPAVKAVKKDAKNINKYSDPKREKLVGLIAKREKISKENIYISNGIDGAIEAIFKSGLYKKSEILLPVPTFLDYGYSASIFGHKIKKVFLDKNFKLKIEKLLAKVTDKTNLIILANPNNPTGNIVIDNKEIEELLKKFKGHVIVDETYYEFSKATCINLLKKYQNLIIFRGFSKGYGLAGLRIGVIIAHKKVIEKINQTEGKSNMFIVSRLALKAAEAILENERLASKFVDDFLKLKTKFEKKMSQINGLINIPSQTSFSLFKLSRPLESMIKTLKDKRVLIKSTKAYQRFPKDIMIIGVPEKKNINTVFNLFQKIL